MFELSITTLLALLKTFGVGLTQTAVILYLLWKIANNHLAHIAKDIKDIALDVKEVKDELQSMKGQCVHSRERIAKIEGKIE